jgi:hypothetical protein
MKTPTNTYTPAGILAIAMRHGFAEIQAEAMDCFAPDLAAEITRRTGLALDRGFLTCSPHDGRYRLTPTGRTLIEATHSVYYNGTDDDMDARCDGCDSRPHTFHRSICGGTPWAFPNTPEEDYLTR